MSLQQSVLAPTSEQSPLRLAIHATDVALVLMPVMSAIHRRHCQITELSYAAPTEDGGRGHLEVLLHCPRSRRHTVPHWLTNVIGVLGVEELPSPAAATG